MVRGKCVQDVRWMLVVSRCIFAIDSTVDVVGEGLFGRCGCRQFLVRRERGV